jgi:tetratricopeptide (TPR) repeat protein
LPPLALVPALLKKFPANDDIADDAATAHATMSALLNRGGDRQQGLKESRESASIREGVLARHPHDVFRRRLLMIAYGHIGDQLSVPVFANPGDAIEAKGYFDKCVAIARGIVKDDPQDRTARYDLANALLRQGATYVPGSDRAGSLAPLREAAEILESLGRENSSAIRYQRPLMLVHQYVGECLRDMGRLDEALVELRRSIEIADARCRAWSPMKESCPRSSLLAAIRPAPSFMPSAACPSPKSTPTARRPASASDTSAIPITDSPPSIARSADGRKLTRMRSTPSPPGMRPT